MASFVENSLLRGEKIEARARISWLSQFWWYVFAALFFFPGIEEGRSVPILAIICLVITTVKIMSTELAATNQRIIGKTGIIRRDTVDLPLEKLESISINQGIIGRFLGYGQVHIRGVGTTNVGIPYIGNPMEFRQAVLELTTRS